MTPERVRLLVLAVVLPWIVWKVAGIPELWSAERRLAALEADDIETRHEGAWLYGKYPERASDEELLVAVPRLVEMLGAEDAFDREGAIFAISGLVSEGRVPPDSPAAAAFEAELMRALDDARPAMRVSAIGALASLCTRRTCDDAISRVQARLDDRAGMVRRSAARTLGFLATMEDRAALTALEDLADHDDEGDRAAALDALVRIRERAGRR